jgi:septation ring formation regulator EzrA
VVCINGRGLLVQRADETALKFIQRHAFSLETLKRWLESVHTELLAQAKVEEAPVKAELRRLEKEIENIQNEIRQGQGKAAGTLAEMRDEAEKAKKKLLTSKPAKDTVPAKTQEQLAQVEGIPAVPS